MIDGFKLVVQPEELRKLFVAKIKEGEEKLAEVKARCEARTVSDRIPESDAVLGWEATLVRFKYLASHLANEDYLLTTIELTDLGLIPR